MKRLPTPEERRLWRESNRLTSRKRAPDEDDEPTVTDEQEHRTVTVAAAPSPPAVARQRTALASLKALSAREAKRTFRLYPIDATLDLHGLTRLEAYAQVQHFIARQQAAGRRHVLIITGKGRGSAVGILRTSLPHWLNETGLRPLISAFSHARPEKGGAGVTHVLLKKP